MRTLALFVIGLVFGGGVGFVTAAGMGVTFDGHDHTDPAHHGAPHKAAHGATPNGMDHDTPLEVTGPTPPQVAITLSPDPMSGYNLHVMTQNFAFAPQQASRAHADGQGHAHVYINGEKQARLYGPWTHLAALPKGEVTVEVTLNSNNHRPLSANGVAVAARTTLEVD